MDLELTGSWFLLTVLAQNPEAGEGNEGYVYEVESLPSYTVVTGLPSYEEAMKQLQEIRTIRRASLTKQTSQEETDGSTPTQNAESATKSPRRLSLAEMFLRRLSKSWGLPSEPCPYRDSCQKKLNEKWVIECI